MTFYSLKPWGGASLATHLLRGWTWGRKKLRSLASVVGRQLALVWLSCLRSGTSLESSRGFLSRLAASRYSFECLNFLLRSFIVVRATLVGQIDHLA